jgi:hypothetical protein
MSEKQVGTIIEVKGQFFLETNDPNNARKKVILPLSSIPGNEKFGVAVGKEVTVWLSQPQRYVAAIDATKFKIPKIICYIPREMFFHATVEPAAVVSAAKALLDRKEISQELYKQLTE